MGNKNPSEEGHDTEEEKLDSSETVFKALGEELTAAAAETPADPAVEDADREPEHRVKRVKREKKTERREGKEGSSHAVGKIARKPGSLDQEWTGRDLEPQYQKMAGLVIRSATLKRGTKEWGALSEQREDLDREAAFRDKENKRLINIYKIDEAKLDKGSSDLLQKVVEELVLLKIGLYADNEDWITRLDESLYQAYLEASKKISSIPFDFTKFYRDMLGKELYEQLAGSQKAKWERAVQSQPATSAAETPAAPVVDVQTPAAAEQVEPTGGNESAAAGVAMQEGMVSGDLAAKYRQAAELLRQIDSLQAQLDLKFPDLDELEKLNTSEYTNDPLFTQVRDLRNELSDLKSNASFGPAERDKLIEKYELGSLYDGTDDPNHEAHGLLNQLGGLIADLRMDLLADKKDSAVEIAGFVNNLLNEFRQKFPNSVMSRAYVLQDVLGEDLFRKLTEYWGEDLEQEDFDRFPNLGEAQLHQGLRGRLSHFFKDLGRRMNDFGNRRQKQATAGIPTQPKTVKPDSEEETAATAEEEQQAGRMAKAVKALIGSENHFSKFIKNPRIQKTLAVSTGVILASLFGAPLAAGATGGAIVCGGMKLGYGIYKGAKEKRLKGLIGNLTKGAGSGLKNFLLSPFNAPKERPLEFKKISQHRLRFKEQSRFKHFVNKWVLEGVAGRGLGVGLGLTVAMVNELPVNSAVRILGQIFGLQVTESAISAYAAGFIPRQFLLLSDLLQKRDEKRLRKLLGDDYDGIKDKFELEGSTLGRVANIMAKTASFVAAAAEITKLDERILASNPELQRSIGVTRGKPLMRGIFGTSEPEGARQLTREVEEETSLLSSPKQEVANGLKNSPTGIDQPELDVEKAVIGHANGGGEFDKIGLEPQASVGETGLEEIMEPEITVEKGGTFWGSMEIQDEGWVNPDNGVTQGDVLRDATADLLRAKGVEVDRIAAGTSFDLAKLLTSEEEELLRRIASTTNAGDYWGNIRPEYLRLVKKAAAEAMRAKGVN